MFKLLRLLILSLICTVYGYAATPQITSSPVTSATEDSVYTYNVTLSDADNDKLNLKATTKPSWLNLISNTTTSNANFVSNLNKTSFMYFDNATGDMYSTDPERRVAFVRRANGTIETVFGVENTEGNDNSHLDSPYACKVGPDGNIYITDSGTGNNRVIKLNSSFVYQGEVSIGEFVGDIAFDSNNNDAYVSAQTGIFKIDLDNFSNGAQEVYNTKVGTEDNSEYYNFGIAIYNGYLYGARLYNHTVVKYDINNFGNGFEIVAGQDNLNGNTGDGGLAIDAKLDGPRSLTFDGFGNLYIADRNNGLVRQVDTDGTITTVTFPSSFTRVMSVDFYDGKIYVSNWDNDTTNNNSTIEEYQINYKLTGTPANENVGTLNNEVTLQVDDGSNTSVQSFTINVQNVNDAPTITSTPVVSATVGNLYSYNITASDDDGDLLNVTATTKPSWLNFSTTTVSENSTFVSALNKSSFMYFDTNGDMYSTDPVDNIAFKRDVNGNVTTLYSNLNTPYACKKGPDGYIYITDWGNKKIVKLNGDGSFNTSLSLTYGPSDVVFKDQHTAFVATDKNVVKINLDSFTQDSVILTNADTDNKIFGMAYSEPYLYGARIFDETVVRYDMSNGNPQSTETLIAGTSDTKNYTGDGGLATNALLNSPRSVSIDGFGNLYIADRDNGKVRKIDSTDQTISTVSFPNSFNDLMAVEFFDGKIYISNWDSDTTNNNSTIEEYSLNYLLEGTPTATTNSKNVTLLVDDGNATNTQTFTINIVASNNAPTDISLSSQNIDENILVNTTVATISSTDSDGGDTATYTLVSGTGADDNSDFTISGTSLKINQSPNFEQKSSYSIRLRVTDSAGAYYEEAFTIAVNNINDQPTNVKLDNTIINENNSIGALVANLTTVDEDTANTHTYSLVSGEGDTDNSKFSITGSKLYIQESANYESKSSYSIRIQTLDNSGDNSTNTYAKKVLILVNNINDAPTISGTPNTSVAEDSAYSFTPTANDDDTGDTLTFSITNKPSWASFNTTTGKLSGTPTNSNVGTTSNIVIRVKDSSNTTVSLSSFNLTVTNTNDAPTISGTPATTVNEDSAYSFTPSANDVDSGDTLTFSITNKPSWASFSTSTGKLTGTPTNSDVGTTSNIIISVKDSSNATASLSSFNLQVVSVNDAPTISGTPNTIVKKNNSYSFTPTANDVDVGDTLTFSITNKPSWASFNTTTGALTGTPTNSDVGTTSNIIISVKDSSNATSSLSSFNLTVTNTLPTSSNFAVTTNEDTAYTFITDDFNFSDSDIGDSFSGIKILSLPAKGILKNGTVVLNINDTISKNDLDFQKLKYTPTTNESGNSYTNFTYGVSDGIDYSNPYTVTINVSAINDAPSIITNLTDENKAEDFATFTKNIQISDIDQDSLNLVASTNSNIITLSQGWTNPIDFTVYDGVNQVLTIDSVANKFGIAIVDIKVSDSSLNDIKSFKIEVPAILDFPNISAEEISLSEDFGTYDITLTNIDLGAQSTGTITIVPSDTTIYDVPNPINITNADAGTKIITLTSKNNTYANTTATITVDNGVDTPVSKTITINVISQNDTPTISGVPNTSVNESDLYSFTPSANDVDTGDSVTFSITNKPSWASFNTTTGKLSGTPTNSDVGTTSNIVISVKDSLDATASLAAFDLTVSNVNDTPTISGTPSTTINQDSLYSFTPTVNDNDVGDTLTFSIVNKPGWASFDTTTGKLSGTPTNSDVGITSNITIIVKDSANAAASLNSFNLEVVNINDAPTINGTPNTSVNENESYSFTPTANDIDVGDTLTFNITNKPSWASFDITTGKLSGTPTSSDIGTTLNIVISVKDSLDTTTSLSAFDLTVSNVNDTPTINGIPNTSVNENEAYSFTPSANDIDVGDILTFSIVNKPSWASFDTTTGKLSGTPTSSDIGTTSNIIISVKDSANATVSLAAFSIEVIDVNYAPSISGTPLTTINQDGIYSFEPSASDVENSKLTYSILNKPTWANFDTTTGVLSGTPTNSDVGITTDITISVSDGEKFSSLNPFNLEVVNINDIPTITGTPTTTVIEDEPYLFIPIAADIDVGDILTFSITNKPNWASFDTTTGELSGTPTNSDIGTTSNIIISVKDSGDSTASLAAFNLKVLRNPINDDSDNDGIPDIMDTDDDNDGISDIEEGINETPPRDTDNDGIPDYKDTDSDGDGKLDSVEYLLDDDNDGIPNYLDENDYGSNTPIDNGNGTQSSTFKKVSDSTDTKTTKITTPIGKPVDINDNSDGSTTINIYEPNSKIDINSDGSLDINLNQTGGKHNIFVSNPGADVEITNPDNNMIISTPVYINPDGTTCQYDVQIQFDGSDMITKHYLNKGEENEVVTTTIMKIPNASIKINSNNQVIHTGVFTNTNSVDTNVTGIISCDGSIQTITNIQGETPSFVAVNKAGSTVVIDTSGDVDTTTALENSNEQNNSLEGLNFKIDSDTGEITASKVFKDKTTNQITYVDIQTYLLGVKLTTSKETIDEVDVDFSNIRFVQVDITDTKNNKISSTMEVENSIDDKNIHRTSQGEDGSITTQVDVEQTQIIVNNRLDGKIEHIVTVDGKTTKALSNLEGANTKIENDKVVTAYKPSDNTTLEVETNKQGKTEHKLKIGEIITQAIFNISGTNTQIIYDENNKPKISTTLEFTNVDNKLLDIRVDANSNGWATHKLVLDKFETSSIIQLLGAKTQILDDGEVQTDVLLDENTSSEVIAYPNGNAKHEVKTNSFDSYANFNIKGAKTTVKDTKEVETNLSVKTKMCQTLDYYVIAKINTDINGRTTTLFDKFNCLDDSFIKTLKTIKEKSFEPNNIVDVRENNGLVEISTKTQVNENIQF